MCGWKGLGKGVSCGGRVLVTCGVRWSSYRLSSHVLLAFWAFAGVVMVTGHRPPPGLRCGGGGGEVGWGAGVEGRGVRGAAVAQTPPLRGSPRPSAPPRRPSPGSSRPRPAAAAPLSRPGLPAPVRSVRSRCSDSSSRRRRRHGPGAGAYVTSACPSATPPTPAGGDVTRRSGLGGGTRRGRRGTPPSGRACCAGEPASPESRATWGPQSQSPGPHRRAAHLGRRSPPEVPTRGLRSGGRGLGSLGPREGTEGVGKGATSPTPRPLAAPGSSCPPPHNFSVTAARHSGERRWGGCKGSPAASVLPSGECPGFPSPPWGLAPPSAWALPRPSDPLSPRGLGAAARDVQTQLSARARDSRIAFGQSRAAARGGGGRRTGGTGEWRHHAEAGTHTQDGAPPGGVCACGWVGAQGAECLEWEAGRSLLRDFAVKEGVGEEREEEGAERSPLRAGDEIPRGKRPRWASCLL